MRAADDAIMAALEAAGLRVHDGLVLVTATGETQRVVTYPLPFVVYYSNVGDESGERLAGRTTRYNVFFSLTYVGLTAEQAKWAGEKARAALSGVRFTIPGHKVGICVLDESQRVRRDDDAIRPDGAPLFYGVDNYSVFVNKPVSA